ncbi:DUF2293 domain-containing protein [Aureimonas frigidaquae]|uniref:DUF2293 domain-containing protein n=1 Tax=Aureimonas frigidaquae TaxID=424757 RepID=UPI0007817379|nr:DUF2293 domain-containing protein [Aureimonas frigidaquae]
MATERQRVIDRALRTTLPRIPYLDAAAIRADARARHLRSVPAEQAFWLAAIAHIRHQHTEYDALRDDGYDRDSAFFFILDDINAVLDRWGATRRLTSAAEAEPPEAETDA